MDIKQSDLGLLLALDALLSDHNVTRAASRLAISQPAMSAQLARLRRMFDDPLLVASGRQMMPTARALALQEPLHAALEELAQLVRERQPFDPATSTRTFRVIAADYLHSVVTVPLILALRSAAPGVKLALLPFDPATAWPMLENLKADMLIAWREVTPEAARAKKLYDDRLCLVQRLGHPRGDKKLTVDAVCKLQHIVISPEGGAMRGPVDDALEKLGKERTVVASVPSFLSAPALVMQTDLVTSMPRRLAELMPDLVAAFDLPFELPSYEIFCSWHARMHHDLGHQWLRDQMAAPFRSA